MTRHSIPEKKEGESSSRSFPPAFTSDHDSDADSDSSPSSSSPPQPSSLETVPKPHEVPAFVPSSLSFPGTSSSPEEKTPTAYAPSSLSSKDIISLRDEPASLSASSSAPTRSSLSSSFTTEQEQRANEDPETTRRNYELILQRQIINKEKEEKDRALFLAEERERREAERRVEAARRLELVRQQQEEERRAREENDRLARAVEEDRKLRANQLRIKEEERRAKEEREEIERRELTARAAREHELKAKREEDETRLVEQQRCAQEDALKITELQRQVHDLHVELETVHRESQKRQAALTLENERLRTEKNVHLELIFNLQKEKEHNALLVQQQTAQLERNYHETFQLLQAAREKVSRLEAERDLREQEMVQKEKQFSTNFGPSLPHQTSSSQMPFDASQIIIEQIVKRISPMLADIESNILDTVSENQSSIVRRLERSDRDSNNKIEEVQQTINQVLTVSSASKTLIEGQRNLSQENINQGRRVSNAIDEVKNIVVRNTADIMSQNDLTKQTIERLTAVIVEKEVPQGLGEQEKENINKTLRTLEEDRLNLEHRLTAQDLVLKDLSAQARQNNTQVIKLKDEMTGVVYHTSQETLTQIMKLSSLIEAKNRGQFKLPNKVRFNPSSIAITSNNYIFVVDSFSHSLHFFDWQGLFVKTVGSEGEAPGQFYLPSSVSVSKDDQVLVCDKGNNRLQIFDTEGNLLHCFGPKDFPDFKLITPFSACFDDRGFIYVCDQEQGAIFVFNSEKRPIFSFSGPPTKRGLPFSPTDIIVHQDLVYVSEFSSGRILIFNLEGDVINVLDRLGLKNPNGLALNDQTNELVISESGTSKIVLLDLERFTLSDVDQVFEGLIEGITLDLDGNLLVCDSTLHTIHTVPL